MIEKEKITLQFDYLQGPIWISDFETGEPLTGIDVIDNDEELRKLNYECSQLYSECYEFNTNEEACFFNTNLLVKNKPRIMQLIASIKDRINSISDNAIVIEDLVTPEMEKY